MRGDALFHDPVSVTMGAAWGSGWFSTDYQTRGGETGDLLWADGAGGALRFRITAETGAVLRSWLWQAGGDWRAHRYAPNLRVPLAAVDPVPSQPSRPPEPPPSSGPVVSESATGWLVGLCALGILTLASLWQRFWRRRR